MKAYVASNDNDSDIVFLWTCEGGLIRIKRKDLPEGCNPQWEDDEPIEVELTIKMKG